jgi:hypothetical protein
MPWLAGHGRTWRRAAFLLALGGFVLNLPAYLIDEGRIYEVVKTRRSPAIPLGPVVPRHRDPGAPGRVHPYQRVHDLPAEASWLEGPGILFTLCAFGDGSEAGGAGGDERNDSALLRILLGRPALHSVSGVGRLLLDDADVAAEVDPERALKFARAAIDFGGPPVDARALSSMLLLRSGRAAEAASLCREALALDPARADVRSNLALAEKILRDEGVK